MPSANLAEADADGILAKMSDVLRTLDGFDDIDCNVAFCRDGDITEYAIGDGIIDTQGEFDEVFALPENVKVARGVDFCGRFDPSWGGCARGGSFVVERSPSEAALWAHEYGHNRGLGHRDDSNAVMNPTLLSTTLRVNSGECIAYHNVSLTEVAFSMRMSTSAAATRAVAAPAADIRDFVRQTFIHGVPYDQIMSYNPNVIPALLEMLANLREERAWPNIVVMTGMLGDDRVADPLISFIEGDPGGELSYFEYEAKKNAIFGLGYLVNRNGNQRALSYLIDSLDPAAWTERRITWASPEHEAAAERNRELSRVAIIGLGLSGNPSAAEALRELLTAAPTAAGTKFREEMSGVISEVLKANQRIAEEGLATYYRKPTP